MTGKTYLLGAVSIAGVVFAGAASAQDTIKLGELNSYKNFPAFLEPYKKGWELAVEETNKAGGVLGKKLEIVSRDDNGNPGDAVRVAEELLNREKVAFLIGTFPSRAFLAQPLAERKAQIEALRRQSETEKSNKAEAIMDVNADAVLALLRSHEHPSWLIHGHTHRPGRHVIEDAGQVSTRWVLGDWHDDCGNYLRCTADGCEPVLLTS